MQEVFWGRSYPTIVECEKVILKKKSWGRRLLYDVYMKKTEELLGTVHVLYAQDKNSIVVKLLVSKSKKLKARLKDIQEILKVIL